MQRFGARRARARGVPPWGGVSRVRSRKVISDVADFKLQAVDRLLAADGSFQSVRFACYVALSTWLWGATIALARNSAGQPRA